MVTIKTLYTVTGRLFDIKVDEAYLKPERATERLKELAAIGNDVYKKVERAAEDRFSYQEANPQFLNPNEKIYDHQNENEGVLQIVVKEILYHE